MVGIWFLGNMADRVLVASELALAVNPVVVMGSIRLCESFIRRTITGSYHKTLRVRQETSKEWLVFRWIQEDRRQRVRSSSSDSPECGVCLTIQLRIRMAAYSGSAEFWEIKELAYSYPVLGQPGTAAADVLRWACRRKVIADRDTYAASWSFSVLQQFEKMVFQSTIHAICL